MAGTERALAISSNISRMSLAPITFTVFTETCTITGERVCCRGREHRVHADVDQDVERTDAVAVVKSVPAASAAWERLA